MLGYFMMDLSKSTNTGAYSAPAQEFSSPEYLPGEVVIPRVGVAPFMTMSYFS